MGAVWVVLQHRDGKLHRMAREALNAGAALAAETGGPVEAVLLGHGVGGLAEEVGATALGAVHVADHESLAAYTPGATVEVLRQAIRAAAPAWVVFPHTYQTVDFMARLAQALEAPMVPEATAFESGDAGLVWRRPVLGGKLVARVAARGEGPALVSVQSGAWPGEPLAAGSAAVGALEIDWSSVRPDREILGVEEVAGEQVDLSAADVVVAVGRGIGDKEKMGIVEELAAALGAEIGASRPVIDSEWLPRDRQIGSSGQTVAPKLYVAVGISGAIQHLVGMKGSQVVVAINKDAGAPIFSVAHYGIVGDLHEVVPALTAAILEKRAG